MAGPAALLRGAALAPMLLLSGNKEFSGKEDIMLKSSLIGALCLVALVAVGSLAAQSSSDTQSKPQEQYLTGTVVSTSSTTLVVKTDAGDQMTFDIDSQSALPAQLQAGTKVDVGYKSDSGGKYHAMEVRAIGSTGSSSGSDTGSNYG